MKRLLSSPVFIVAKNTKTLAHTCSPKHQCDDGWWKEEKKTKITNHQNALDEGRRALRTVFPS